MQLKNVQNVIQMVLNYKLLWWKIIVVKNHKNCPAAGGFASRVTWLQEAKPQTLVCDTLELHQ